MFIILLIVISAAVLLQNSFEMEEFMVFGKTDMSKSTTNGTLLSNISSSDSCNPHTSSCMHPSCPINPAQPACSPQAQPTANKSELGKLQYMPKG
jgi:hypothetical protein